MAALKSLTHAIQLDPDSPESDVRRYQLATTELSLGMTEEAIALLSQLSRLPSALRPVASSTSSAGLPAALPLMPAAYSHTSSAPAPTPAGGSTQLESKGGAAADTSARVIEVDEAPVTAAKAPRKAAAAGDSTAKPFFPAIKLLSDALYARARNEFAQGAYSAAHTSVHACLWSLHAGLHVLRTTPTLTDSKAGSAGAGAGYSQQSFSSSDLGSLPPALVPLPPPPAQRFTNLVSLHKLMGDAYALLAQLSAPVVPVQAISLLMHSLPFHWLTRCCVVLCC
jgi:hypothetical protein